MMHFVLFIIYFLLLCLLVTRMRFFNSSIKPAYLVILFSLHIITGCIHTWVAYRFFPGHGDIWTFFEESIVLKQQLLAHTQQFIERVVSPGQFNLTDPALPLLDFQYQFLQYINVFLDFFSFNNFYINTLLFSFPVFAGSMALFKVFYSIYAKPLPSFCTLLLPSVLFWSAVLYKDGLFYMACGYFFYYALKPSQPFLKMILLVLFTGIMFFSRSNALLTLFPAVLFLSITQQKTAKKGMAIIFTTITVMAVTAALNAFLDYSLLTRICNRQKDFLALIGGSKIYLPLLVPTGSSFLQVLPVALLNGFFQPLPGAGGKLIYNLFSIELLSVWTLVFSGCWWLIRNKTRLLGNFDIACLLFAVPGMIIIGYMVPFAGAIIRYRSIYLPFLLAPFMNQICLHPFKQIIVLDNWLRKNVIAVNAL